MRYIHSSKRSRLLVRKSKSIDMFRSPAMLFPTLFPGQLEFIRSRGEFYWGIPVSPFDSLDFLRKRKNLVFTGPGGHSDPCVLAYISGQ